VSEAKPTMSLNLTVREMKVVEEMCAEMEISKTQLMRQALRVYQMVHVRAKRGERIMFSGDPRMTVEFVGIGLSPMDVQAAATKEKSE